MDGGSRVLVEVGVRLRVEGEEEEEEEETVVGHLCVRVWGVLRSIAIRNIYMWMV